MFVEEPRTNLPQPSQSQSPKQPEQQEKYDDSNNNNKAFGVIPVWLYPALLAFGLASLWTVKRSGMIRQEIPKGSGEGQRLDESLEYRDY